MNESVGRPLASDRFIVLTVCIGNICRSPVAALLVQHELGSLVEASSAGTHAVVGAGVHPEMAVLLEAAGVAPEGRARQVTEAMLRSADLVLTMTRALRSDVVGIAPSVVRRAFTLPELAAIAERETRPGPAADRAGLVDAVARAAAHRATVAGLGDALDIADPYGRAPSDYRRAFSQIQDSVDTLRAAWLGG